MTAAFTSQWDALFVPALRRAAVPSRASRYCLSGENLS